jgi:hypothetical protein
MKTILLVTALVFTVLAANAQNKTASDSTSSKVYAGIELTTITYSLANAEKHLGVGVNPYAQFNLGYRVSNRMNVQIGIGYGRDKVSRLESIYYGHGDTIIYRYNSRNNYGLAIPLTAQYTPFNPGRRLNIYATTSLIPVFGEVNQQESETYEGETKVTYEGHDSGLYLLATAGLVLNYKISNRFEGYGKANLLYKDLSGYSYYAERAKSIAIGLNYNF